MRCSVREGWCEVQCDGRGCSVRKRGGGGVSYDRLSREEKVLSPHFLACLVN